MQPKFINFSIGNITTAINADGDEKKQFKPPVNWQKFTKSTIKSNHSNMAVLTGVLSNVTVMDFDNMDSFNSFIKDYPELKDCYMVRTKNGIHIYFNYVALLKNTTNISDKYSAVDIRNDGGFVIAPTTKCKTLDGKTHKYKLLEGQMIDFPEYLFNIIKSSCLTNYIKKQEVEIIELDGTDQNQNMILEFTELLLIDDINNYASWRNLVWSIRSMGINFKQCARVMSQRGSTYDSSSFNRTWNSFGINKKSITSELFYNFCKKGNKKQYDILREKYKLPTIEQKVINDYLTRDFTNIKRFIEESKYTMCTLNKSNEWVIRFRKEVEETKHVILWSDMGKGKIQYIDYCLNLNISTKPTYNILFLSSRKSFANFMEGKFKHHGIKNYLNCKESKISEPRLVIQMESLHKLDTNIIYDTVVIDECESVFKQLSSTTMTQIKKVYNNLIHVIKNASKVLYCDAFILNRTFDFCRGIQQEDEKIVCIHNTLPSNKRDAIQIKNKDFDDQIIENFIINKKTYVCSTSELRFIASQN